MTISNYSIIVNYKEKGFGCSKACSYCNWRTSELLPHGIQDELSIKNFIEQCPKEFITLSGGGDPLWGMPENEDKFLVYFNAIVSSGKKLRVITREIENALLYRDFIDYFSISLDNDVLAMLKDRRSHFENRHVECSLVLPSCETSDISRIFPQYIAIQRQIGFPLVLRENLNSPFPLVYSELPLAHNIRYAPKSCCLDGTYLLQDSVVTGREFLADVESLLSYFNTLPVYIIGGFLKHLIAPIAHQAYRDIDIVTYDTALIYKLTEYNYVCKEVSKAQQYPKYFYCKSKRGLPDIHVITVRDPIEYIQDAQFRCDRVYYRQGFIEGSLSGIQDIKERRLCNYKTSKFHSDEAEKQLILKYKRKGFSYDLP